MKKLLLLALSIVLLTMSLSAQLDKNDALVLLDGKISNIDPNSIDPNTIESLTVLRDQAASDAYGIAGKNGVVLIKTKGNVKPDPSQDEISEILILVNGEEYTSGFNSIDPNIIESLTVLKDQAASDAYGVAGKNGVVLIKTKGNVKPDPSQDEISEILILVNGEEYTSGFNSIDPNIIESLTVLKDQAASDAYGKAGKNGVVLIKTKDNVKLKK